MCVSMGEGVCECMCECVYNLIGDTKARDSFFSKTKSKFENKIGNYNFLECTLRTHKTDNRGSLRVLT